MSTSSNNANYVDSEDMLIGEQDININYKDRDSNTRNSVNVDKSKKWIGKLGIVSSVDIVGSLDLIKEAQYDE